MTTPPAATPAEGGPTPGAPPPAAPPPAAPSPAAPPPAAPPPAAPPVEMPPPLEMPWDGPVSPPAHYPPAYPPTGSSYIPQSPISPARSINTLAVLSLVMAFVFPPAGIVLGYAARRQIRRTGDEGDGLATAGLIAGYAITGVILASCCGVTVFELMDAAGVLGAPARP